MWSYDIGFDHPVVAEIERTGYANGWDDCDEENEEDDDDDGWL